MDNELSPAGGMLIKDMMADERPREKALKYGIKSLSTVELMAIIFGTGIQGKSVINLSNEILLDNSGHLSKVARLTVKDFMNRYKGVGVAKSVALLAALELGSRASADAAVLTDPQITSPESAVDIMRPHLGRLAQEEFWVMLLNQAGRVVKEVMVSRGGLAATMVDVKVVLRHALENYATAMILFHNHPSGNLTPSAQDDNLTSRIVKAAQMLDIRVNDHIILTDGGFYSYYSNNRMPQV